MQGLPPRWKHFKDEIYTKLRGPGRNMEILSTIEENGRHEPIMWTVRYGKGRVFVDVLGHCGNDPEMIYSILCTGFQVNLAAWCRMGLPPGASPSQHPRTSRWRTPTPCGRSSRLHSMLIKSTIRYQNQRRVCRNKYSMDSPPPRRRGGTK